jgi:hypothetical protein
VTFSLENRCFDIFSSLKAIILFMVANVFFNLFSEHILKIIILFQGEEDIDEQTVGALMLNSARVGSTG